VGCGCRISLLYPGEVASQVSARPLGVGFARGQHALDIADLDAEAVGDGLEGHPGAVVEHEVEPRAPREGGGTLTRLRIHGPALVVLAYRPLAALALRRLVST